MVEKSIRADEGIDAFFSPSCTCSTEQGSMCCSGSPRPCPCSRLVQVGCVWGQTRSATANAALRGTGKFTSKVQDQHQAQWSRHQARWGRGSACPTSALSCTNPASTSWVPEKVLSNIWTLLFTKPGRTYHHPACQIQLEFITASIKHGSRTGTKLGGSHELSFL